MSGVSVDPRTRARLVLVALFALFMFPIVIALVLNLTARFGLNEGD